ncbi:MAG: DUF1934 domain-containing protein [Romboutsia sp.]
MDVNITIKTKQFDENGQVDVIEINAKGTVYEKNNDTYIVYKEKEENLEVTNTIKISSDEVSIKKFGSTNSNMVFKKGKTDLIKYQTTHGIFIIENITNELSIKKESDSFTLININYNIKIMDLFKGRNEISIEIKK